MLDRYCWLWEYCAFKGGGLESFPTSAFMLSGANLRQWLLIFWGHGHPWEAVKIYGLSPRKMAQNATKNFAYDFRIWTLD